MVTSSGYALLAALLPWIVCSIRGVLEPEGSDPEEVPKDEDRLQCLRQDNLDLVGTADFASRYILRQVVGVNEDDTESDIYLFADKFRISRVQAELKLSRTGADALAFELVGSNSTEKHTGLGSADMRIREFQLVTQSSVISCATSLASSLAEDCDDPEEQQATVLFHLAGTIRAKKHKGRWEADIVTKEARAFDTAFEMIGSYHRLGILLIDILPWPFWVEAIASKDDWDAQVRAVIKAVMTKAIDVIAVRAEDMGADMIALYTDVKTYSGNELAEIMHDGAAVAPVPRGPPAIAQGAWAAVEPVNYDQHLRSTAKLTPQTVAQMTGPVTEAEPDQGVSESKSSSWRTAMLAMEVDSPSMFAATAFKWTAKRLRNCLSRSRSATRWASLKMRESTETT
ncbi:unnamed protein product, partial [Symbiodinium necroappetens]